VNVDSKVVVSVQGKDDGASRMFESFRAQQQAFAAELLKGIEAQNKKLQETVNFWAKVGAGIVGVAGAVKLAGDAWKLYVQRANLEADTFGVNLDQLRKASAGLKTDTELLSFAQQSLSRDLGLTRREMETVLAAQTGLVRKGHELTKVEQQIGEALKKNEVDPLKDLGIILKQNEDPAKNFTQIMQALADAANDASSAEARVGENVKRASVEVQNGWTTLQVAAGRLVDRGLAPLAGSLGAILDVITDFMEGGALTEGDVNELRRRSGIGTLGDAWANRPGAPQMLNGVGLAQWQGFVDQTFKSMAGIAKDVQVATRRQQTFNEMSADAAKKAAEDAAKAAAAARAAWEAIRRDAIEGDRIATEMQLANLLDPAARVTEGFSGGLADLSAFGVPQDASTKAMREAGARTQSKLEQIFGPIEEFDAYAHAWGTLQNAVTSALDAWITGSMGAGQAVKLAIAEGLRALAIDMTVRSLREFATAAAMLATPLTAPLAAGHAKAGALYAGGAAAAAIGARALGAGGGGVSAGGGSAGAGAAAPVGSAGTAGGERVVTIIATGHDFGEDSARVRQQRARQLVRTAEGAAGAGVAFR
jgi:hypothetical protein